MSNLDELREKIESIAVIEPHDTTVGDLLGSERMDIVMELFSHHLEQETLKARIDQIYRISHMTTASGDSVFSNVQKSILGQESNLISQLTTNKSKEK